MKKLSRKILSVLLVIAMLVPTGALTIQTNAETESIEIGDYITLGTYYGEPIVWRCVDIDENGPLMLSDKILCLKAFDANGENSTYHSDGWGYIRKSYGSNCWYDSNIRQWLNTSGMVEYTHCAPSKDRVYGGYNAYDSEVGFLTGFTANELSMIKTVTQKVYVNSYEATREGYCDGGSYKLNYSVSSPGTDYSNYYYQNVTDMMFFLNPHQIDSVYSMFCDYLINAYPTQNAVDNSDYKDSKLSTTLPWEYWLGVACNGGASYEHECLSSTIGGTQNIATARGCYAGYYGVRPAFYLNVEAYENSEQFPDGYDPLLDKYGFTNPSQIVESEIYKTVYGSVKGAWMSFVHENGKAHGLCYGMASTTAALLKNRSTINSFSLSSPDMNLGNVEFMSNIYEGAYSNVLNMDIITFVKYGYVYQFATERDSTINNLNGLYSAVKSYVDGNGSGIVISIWHGTKYNRKHGHAVLATGVKETNNEYIILIDDSNFWTQTELFISKDFSTWRYSVSGTTLSDGTPYDYNSSNGIISYDIPGSVVYNLGLLAGAKTRTSNNYLNENRLLVTSTDSLVENNNLSEIFVTEDSDSAANDSLKLYWADEDMNGIELSAINNNSEVTVSDVSSSVSVVLDSKENASFYVDDDNTNKLSYSSKNNENSNIVFTSVDEKGEIVTITLTGTANGNEVAATETEDGIQVTGLNDITVTYETADGTGATRANVDDGSTVNIIVDDPSNTVTTDWNCKHEDTDHDGVCDVCLKDFTLSCSHICHNDNAFVQFIWKIINFLYRIFGINQYCDCGKAHW